MLGSPPKPFGRQFYVVMTSVALAATLAAAPARSQSLSPAEIERRDAAVVAARGSEYAEALTELRALSRLHPDEASLTYDLATVLAWSEDDTAAVTLAESLNPSDAPAYAQHAIAKSARNLLRFEVAAAWYDAVLRASPDDADAFAGRLMTAADAGDIDTVRSMIQSVEPDNDAGPVVRLAIGYGLLAAGDLLPALAAYDAVLDNDADNSEALRGKALVLRALLLPTQALALASEHPGILSDNEIERLGSDEAAIRLRLTTRTPYPEPDVYTDRDAALASLNQQLRDARTEQARNALLLDRVVALSDANDPAAAIAQFEALPESANTDQAFVLVAAAGAYLALKQPERALPLIERALELAPQNIDARFTQIYAWLDLEHYDEAYAATRELTATLPMMLQAPGSPVTKGNESRMRAEILAGIAEAYGDQLAAAQARFESILASAPNNNEVRQELANIYRWRGWLDRSVNEYRAVRTNSEDLLGAEVGHAHAMIDARDFAAAEATLAEVSPVYEREPAVQQLTERWLNHNRSELIVSAASGDSTGPVTGANHYSVDARWYTAPIRYRYRALVTSHDSFAEFPEGESRRRRLGAGIEYRSPRFTVTGIASGSRDNGSAGAEAEVDVRLNDYWSVSAGLGINSDIVQPRAHRLGIEADRTFVSTRFAPHELADIEIEISQNAYSDDNTITSAAASGRLRVVNRPRSKLDAIATLATGRADTAAVPYFSPERDRSAAVGLNHAWRIFRRYEHSLVQNVRVSTGRYYQQGFDTGSSWSAAYALDWERSERLAFSFGVERLGQFFDGQREHATVGTISVRARL